jgi:hypothetical protein
LLPAPAPVPLVKKVRLATVADQANDLEVAELSADEVAKAYANFENITGGPPAQDEELTLEQLSVLHALLAGAGPPYVDFAVWGPFGHRISKKMRLTGLQLGPRGELRQAECFGPATFLDWEASYKVWRTGCLMLGAMSINTLDLYYNTIKSYVQRYGPSVWMLLYQADVRARM